MLAETGPDVWSVSAWMTWSASTDATLLLAATSRIFDAVMGALKPLKMERYTYADRASMPCAERNTSTSTPSFSWTIQVPSAYATVVVATLAARTSRIANTGKSSAVASATLRRPRIRPARPAWRQQRRCSP